MAARNERRSFWTWGHVSDEPGEAERRAAAARLAPRLGAAVEPPPIPRLEDVALRAARITVPDRLSAWVRQDAVDRLSHTYGGPPIALLAALRGPFDEPPDAVAHPRNEDELEATMAWCDATGTVAIP